MPLLITLAIGLVIWAWHKSSAEKERLAQAQLPLALPPPPPPEDSDETAAARPPGGELRWRTTVRLRLYYSDTDGSATERVVDVTHFDSRSQGLVFAGHCHLRRARRTFRLDRVSACVHPETGEVIRDPWSLFVAASPDDPSSRSPRRPKATPLDAHAEVVRLLVFVGKADGRLMPAERKVIVDACNSLIQGPPWADDAELQRAIARYGVPSDEEFAAGAARLAHQNPSAFRCVATAAEQVVATQKTVHANEVAALDQLRSLQRV